MGRHLWLAASLLCLAWACGGTAGGADGGARDLVSDPGAEASLPDGSPDVPPSDPGAAADDAELSEAPGEQVEPPAEASEVIEIVWPDLPPDAEIPLSVELSLEQVRCDEEAPELGLLHVSLTWTTSLPARSTVEVALNDLDSAAFIPVEEPAQEIHALAFVLTASHFPLVPRVGDAILMRVRATSPQGAEGVSEPLAVAVSESVRACLYPYDPECSDNAPILCRVMPSSCEPPRVLAAFEGCYHCVYSATCTCDDGQPVVCASPAPECEGGQVLAAQEGCERCVDPFTCAPLLGR